MWEYRYELEGQNLTNCPDCGYDLTQQSGIELEVTVNEVPMDFPTRLEDGTLVDVDNLVMNGYHSRTLCGKCGVLLIDCDGVEEINDLETEDSDAN